MNCTWCCYTDGVFGWGRAYQSNRNWVLCKLTMLPGLRKKSFVEFHESTLATMISQVTDKSQATEEPVIKEPVPRVRRRGFGGGVEMSRV